MHAAAIAAVTSLPVYLPVYVLACGDRLLAAPVDDIALQAVVQGVLTAVVSLILYGRAVAILGASSGAAFAAICPALTALFGIALLGEMPNSGRVDDHRDNLQRRLSGDRWAVAAMAPCVLIIFARH